MNTTSNSALAVFDPLKAMVAVYASGLVSVDVRSPESAQLAIQQLNEASRIEKEIEKARKAYVGPLNDQVKLCNSHAKSIVEDLTRGIQSTRRQLADWELKLDRERQAAKAEADRARAEEQEKIRIESLKNVTPEPPPAPPEDSWDAVFNASGDTMPADPMAELAAASKRAEIERREIEVAHAHHRATKEIEANRVKGSKKVWKFQVEEAGLVPREYLMVDERLIRQAIAGGVREIPGVRVYEDVIISSRGS